MNMHVRPTRPRDMRDVIGDAIERLIAIADAIDGDLDYEPVETEEGDNSEDLEPDDSGIGDAAGLREQVGGIGRGLFLIEADIEATKAVSRRLGAIIARLTDSEVRP